MRNTAHVTFQVEYDPELEAHPKAHNWSNGVIYYPGVVIGEPKLTVHRRHLCAISSRELGQLLTNIEDRGGSFMKALGAALARADGANAERLLGEFWNEFSAYMPTYTELPT